MTQLCYSMTAIQHNTTQHDVIAVVVVAVVAIAILTKVVHVTVVRFEPWVSQYPRQIKSCNASNS